MKKLESCEHQREIDITREVEVVTYKLTTAARGLRKEAITYLAEGAARGKLLPVTARAKALVLLQGWDEPCFSPPDADSPLSGCYEVERRETKPIGKITVDQHPEGMLGKPCPVCGHKYGTPLNDSP